jgi:transposase-like protein
MSLVWSRTVPSASRCPRCRSERISFVIPESPEVESWRCLECAAQWEVGPGGQVMLPLPGPEGLDRG